MKSIFGSYKHECGWITPLRVRRQFFDTFFAGGAGYTYGAGPVWAMRGQGGGYNCGYTWQQALEFPGGRQIAGVCKQFLLDHHWPNWVPDQSVIMEGQGSDESLKTAVHCTNGRKTLVYFANVSPATIKNSLGKEANATWFDPRDGQTQKARTFETDASRSMTPPRGWEDAILVMAVVE